jgi:hypothetical protein
MPGNADLALLSRALNSTSQPPAVSAANSAASDVDSDASDTFRQFLSLQMLPMTPLPSARPT